MEQRYENGTVKKPLPVWNIRQAVGEEQLPFEIVPSIADGPTELKNVYIPSWSNRPEPVAAVLTLAGTPILSHQNTSTMIANPGTGKSSIMEAIAASYLNPDADNLGFEVDETCTGIIIIDNERTNTDVWNSFYRTCRRAKIPQGQEINKVVLAGLRSVARLPERIKTIETLLQNNPCSLLLVDGAGDLVLDTNDLAQAIECRIWLRELTVKYNVSILTTLHPNPNTNKPRGHQGSEICREAECVLLAKDYDDEIKIITSDFEHGKNRNNPKLTSAYKWSDSDKMFVTADLDDAIAGKQTAKDGAKRAQAEALAKSVLGGQASLKYGELTEAIADKTSQSEPTAKRKIKDMEAWKIVKKHADGYYRLNLAS